MNTDIFCNCLFQGTHMIYTEGCLPKASHWFERHILSVAIAVAVLAVLQVNSLNFVESFFMNLFEDTWYLFCSKSS
jgi:hypothetical protein